MKKPTPEMIEAEKEKERIRKENASSFVDDYMKNLGIPNATILMCLVATIELYLNHNFTVTTIKDVFVIVGWWFAYLIALGMLYAIGSLVVVGIIYKIMCDFNVSGSKVEIIYFLLFPVIILIVGLLSLL